MGGGGRVKNDFITSEVGISNVISSGWKWWGIFLTFEGGSVCKTRSISTLRLDKEPTIVFIIVGRRGLLLACFELGHDKFKTMGLAC